MKPRNGKIAHLPENIREQLNMRLYSKHPGVVILKWLNALPEVKSVLALRFGGRPVNPPNLFEWKKGGYAEWHKELTIGPGLVERDPELNRLFCSLLQSRFQEAFVQLMHETVVAALECLATNRKQAENGLAQANSSNN